MLFFTYNAFSNSQKNPLKRYNMMLTETDQRLSYIYLLLNVAILVLSCARFKNRVPAD